MKTPALTAWLKDGKKRSFHLDVGKNGEVKAWIGEEAREGIYMKVVFAVATDLGKAVTRLEARLVKLSLCYLDYQQTADNEPDSPPVHDVRMPAAPSPTDPPFMEDRIVNVGGIFDPVPVGGRDDHPVDVDTPTACSRCGETTRELSVSPEPGSVDLVCDACLPTIDELTNGDPERYGDQMNCDRCGETKECFATTFSLSTWLCRPCLVWRKETHDEDGKRRNEREDGQ